MSLFVYLQQFLSGIMHHVVVQLSFPLRSMCALQTGWWPGAILFLHVVFCSPFIGNWKRCQQGANCLCDQILLSDPCLARLSFTHSLLSITVTLTERVLTASLSWTSLVSDGHGFFEACWALKDNRLHSFILEWRPAHQWTQARNDRQGHRMNVT